jgi:hypothetical protein
MHRFYPKFFLSAMLTKLLIIFALSAMNEIVVYLTSLCVNWAFFGMSGTV